MFFRLFLLSLLLYSPRADNYVNGGGEYNHCTLISAGPLEYSISKQCDVIECAKDLHNECQKKSKNAREAQAYIAFIVHNYHNLNGTYIFVHGHSSSWHQRQNIFDAIARFRYTDGFQGLNNIPIVIEHPEDSIFGTIWDAVLAPVISRPKPTRICVDGSTQFAVHASRIKRYPLAVWEELYAYVYGTKKWPGSETWGPGTSRKLLYKPGDFLGTGWFTEYLFGVLLGDNDCIF